MIGVVLDAVDASGAADYTYIVATSDHGDMNAEVRRNCDGVSCSRAHFIDTLTL